MSADTEGPVKPIEVEGPTKAAKATKKQFERNRDFALVCLAGACVIAVCMAIVALAAFDKLDATTVAALSTPGAVGGMAVGRLTGANSNPTDEGTKS